jgi:hypothetical protein
MVRILVCVGVFLFTRSSKSWWRSANLAILRRPTTNDALMDSSLYAVVHFKVQLGKLVFLVRRSLLDITKRRCIHNVADNETGDCLILRNGLSSRDASVKPKRERDGVSEGWGWRRFWTRSHVFMPSTQLGGFGKHRHIYWQTKEPTSRARRVRDPSYYVRGFYA